MTDATSNPVPALAERLDDRPLDVAADLTLSLDGDEIRVESYTDHVTVTLPSLSTGRRLLSHHGGRFGDLSALLAAADLSAEVRVGSRRIARLGSGVAPGPVARRLGWGPVRLRPLGLLLALAFDR